MCPVPVITEPFTRIVTDIVGPLPVTSKGNRCGLVIIDYGSRYPEIVPLPNIHAETIADDLFVVFSRLGFPNEIQHDKGLSFSNKLMEELWKKTGVKQIKSSAYHPETNGVVERLNQTIKNALRTLLIDKKKEWDDYLPYLLFALREVPCRTTGFSPFELLFGRKVRGPLDLLREKWDGSDPNPQGMNVVAHVLQMRERLNEMSSLAKEN